METIDTPHHAAPTPRPSQPTRLADVRAELVHGPLLRYAGTESATIWVETSTPCTVEVLGEPMPTFCVEGHHHAIVLVRSLTPGTVTPYEVRLDGRVVWPMPADPRPAPVVRTRDGERRARILFGSCRVGGPEELPLDPDGPWSDELRRTGIDAIRAVSRELQRGAALPELLVMLGDQVYADEVSPETLAFIRTRRDTTQAPGKEIADFEEYTRLYREAWSDPDIRWLLATVPSAMIFDDHDDWNISARWVDEMRRKPWWEARGSPARSWRAGSTSTSATCRPRSSAPERRLVRLTGSRPAGLLFRFLARRAGVPDPSARWKLVRRPSFHNTIGEMTLDGRSASVAYRRSAIEREDPNGLVPLHRTRLA